MRRRRGVALVLVLWIVVILGAIAATVAGQTRAATAIATNARARLVARYTAESSIEATIATIEDSLEVEPDSAARAQFLNSLESTPAADTVTIDRGRALVAVSDASARLDVNTATEEQLARFFSQFTDLAQAARAARDIRAWIERRAGAEADVRIQLDAGGQTRTVRPLTSLDELAALHVVDQRTLAQAAAYLTVDGDGAINMAAAAPAVRAVAAGEVREEPSRLVVIARGWEAGHSYTHEIQAVYAITANRLVLVHWRERPL
ncbi:MAG: type II secretion system protein GspK [Gemmatimonadaceae bacterium]